MRVNGVTESPPSSGDVPSASVIETGLLGTGME